jgi:hypothetical protein
MALHHGSLVLLWCCTIILTKDKMNRPPNRSLLTPSEFETLVKNINISVEETEPFRGGYRGDERYAMAFVVRVRMYMERVNAYFDSIERKDEVDDI